VALLGRHHLVAAGEIHFPVGIMNAATLNSPSEQPAALLTYLAAAKHRRPWLIATFAIAMVLTIVLALVLPPKFRSAATILIEQQEMPQDFVRSTVTSYADERVQMISKRVMTTETLLNIIKRYDLYPKQRANDTREALLERMRKDISLKMISADVIDPRSGHPTSATIAFEVSYTSVNPELAAKVANELTTAYLNENLNNRTQLARDATTFLESEGDRLNHHIGELEAELAKFKDKHAQQLPELTQLNMQLLDHNNEELRALDSRKSSLEQQKVYLEAQLVQLKPNSVVFSDTGERIVSSADRLKQARSQLDSARAMYSPDHPDVIRLERQVAGLEKQVGPDQAAPTAAEANDLERRLTAAKATLADAEGRYGPEHPDRIRAQREVAALQAQVDAAPAQAAAASKLAPKEADNPAYVQIQAQLSATVNDLAAVQQQADKLRARSQDLQNNLNLGPQVEQQYRELTRDYENTRLKYMEIRSKQAEARTAQNLESDRKGERFTLIEPPLPPEQPVSPNRKLIFLAGMVLSFGLVGGVLWLLETIDTSVRGRLDLLKLTGVPPLALVPYIGTDSERASARRRRRLTFAGAFVSVCAVVVLTHFFYEPLDVLWFSLSRRMGF
jgi:polysaccharide biosynthesis transport protein